jgi:hypothetical protein
MNVFVALVLFAGHTGPTAEQAFASDAPPRRSAEAEVLADRPLAVWRFEEPAGSKRATAERFPVAAPTRATAAEPAVAEPAVAEMSGAVVFGEPGPRPPRHPSSGKENAAALFGAGRSILKLSADTPGFAEFQFTNGDAITLEAWVAAGEIAAGQHVYLIGKGRTGRKEVAADNQNWALRLAGLADGTVAPSFLFRSAGTADARPAFHRWTGAAGFEPDSGWHHVAVTYVFGSPESIRGYFDGRPVVGTWDADLGGSTANPPVVDDDEIWIGSALGGSAAATFNGLLDDVAVHRTALPAERIAARFDIDPAAADPATVVRPEPRPGQVLFEVIEDVPAGSWRIGGLEPTETFVGDHVALVGVPLRYSAAGVREDRSAGFIVRATSHVELPAGPVTLRLRASGPGRVFLDGRRIVQLSSPGYGSDGHAKVFVPDRSGPAGMRPAPHGTREATVVLQGDGQRHVLYAELRFGDEGRRPETGEFSVSVGPPAAVPLVVSPAGSPVPLSDAGWEMLADRLAADLDAENTRRRQAAVARQAEYWQRRHARARDILAATPGPVPPEIPATAPRHAAAVFNDVDRFINAKLLAADIPPADLASDADFIRRLSLDVRGVVPAAAEVEAFLADKRPDRRTRLIDAFLADPRWADHWVGYWQDVLAENPNLVGPTLNNTGPFRFWIHESFLDDKPIDRFATEAVLMEGSPFGGGPGGFALATQNDAPFAAKAHVLGRAFLAMEMNCARCHDAPNHRFLQKDLFSLAAMLGREPQKVPATSSIPGGADRLARLAGSVTLTPGTAVAPAWPFADIVEEQAIEELPQKPDDPRERLAAIVTAPANRRFARVIANRLWARYFSRGLVAELDDWETESPSHPELLDWLGRQLVEGGYSLKSLARLILGSHAYGRGRLEAGRPVPAAMFAGQEPRRMAAEQVVDSLVASSGKPLDVEELTFDIEGVRKPDSLLRLGRPTRSWQFATTANERDRPSLSFPFAQHYVTLLSAFGWRAERQAPITERETDPNVLQPAVLANGVAAKRASQFSPTSGFTALALADQPLATFIDGMFLRILGRFPRPHERQLAVELLADGYDSRRVVGEMAAVVVEERPGGVSWQSHLTEEADRIKMQLAEIAARGDPPTPALDPDWRERAEDLAWTLYNSPEFVFIP